MIERGIDILSEYQNRKASKVEMEGYVKAIFDSYYYIYGLKEADIDLCLSKLGYSDKLKEDRIEKCKKRVKKIKVLFCNNYKYRHI